MPATPPRPRRVAVVGQLDPADPRAWSGTPAGLLKGLREAAAEAVAVDARPPGLGSAARALRLPWTWEATNPAFSAACGAWANRRIAASGADAAIAIGSGFALDGRLPFATFEDETIAQAEGQPETPLASVAERGLQRWRRRQRLIYARARACCVASAWAGDSLREDYGVDPDKIHVVGCGRNLDQEVPEREWSPPRFLFAGVNWERKRGEDVVAAFAVVRRRHPAATLDVVGGHPPLEAPGVTGHGLLSRSSPEQQALLADLFARATCHVLPSSYESFGIAYLDAGAAGVPSIGTTVGGAADAVGPGGLLVNPGDLDALAAAMLDLCDPSRAAALGELARAHSDRFTWQAVAARVLTALS